MLNPWYVTGFSDGEAVFTYSRASGAFNVYFSIRQREDNHEIVEGIQKFFGYVGSIYKSKENTSTERENLKKQATVYYRTSRVDELKRIVEHFDKYPLQSKKQNVYLIWRKMVMHKIENYGNTDYGILRAFAEQLSSLNQKSRAFRVHRT